MTPVARDPEVVSRAMKAVRSEGTAPEILLRQELHQRGLRFVLHRKDLPGTPDIVFPRARVAVFVDGEFWHGRQWSDRGLHDLADAFHTHRSYWVRKIERNIQRDAAVNRLLREMRWAAVRVWANDVKRDAPAISSAIGMKVRERERLRRLGELPL